MILSMHAVKLHLPITLLGRPRISRSAFLNGQYVTPVPDGYFVHLERVRGENKKMKMIENARGAVANGSADPEEIRMATNGAEVRMMVVLLLRGL